VRKDTLDADRARSTHGDVRNA